MELTKVEIAEVEKVADKSQLEISALNDLQLALIGGGCGEVVFG